MVIHMEGRKAFFLYSPLTASAIWSNIFPSGGSSKTNIMKHERKFRERERDYDYDRREKEKKRKGRKGAIGTGELWADLASYGDEAQPEPQQAPKQRRDDPPRKDRPEEGKPAGPAFQFNEASTIEVKGYKIDLSRVKSVAKVQTVHNGRDSFGIEFAFIGTKGLGRTIWYGTNRRQRDEEHATYSSAWMRVNEL